MSTELERLERTLLALFEDGFDDNQVVVTRQMPLSNLTQITDEECAIIGAWFERGASTD